MFKNALISVSDKTGLVEFLKPMATKGIRIVSTGGTAKFLKENGFTVVDVSDQTGFPEVMDGRVKTLHPKVHMALLARQGHDQDIAVLKENNLEPFDLVICNLYPFEKAVESGAQEMDLIEKIDVGGPTMLRAAAKNFQFASVVCDPKDYSWICKKAVLTIEDRRSLAAKVFAHVSAYDAMIAKELGQDSFDEICFAGRQVMELRYGENPQQKASWYRKMGNTTGLHSAEIIQGKPLSYNNLLDLEAASRLVRQFDDAAAVAVKHNNPCGVASGKTLSDAMKRCQSSDPISIFGGIVAVTRAVDKDTAQQLAQIFLECVVAPDYTSEALQILSAKKNLRVLRWPMMLEVDTPREIRSVNGGFLVQSTDLQLSSPEKWDVIGQSPSKNIAEDLVFAEKVCGPLKSNAIAIVKNGQALGLGMGQVNRVDAVAQAIERMKRNHGLIEGAVLASDAFFPFPDSLELAHQAGIRWIIQPGGSLKDDEVFAAAKKFGINMIVSKVRHFRH